MIAIGCDHGGFALMAQIKRHLEEKGYEIFDAGIFEESPTDFPDIAEIVAHKVLEGSCDRGILCCGTGIGMSMAANKIKGIRCALLSDCYSALMTKQHNDANIISLGGRVLGDELAKMIVDTWLTAEFLEGKYQIRIDKLHKLEE